jgi:hypothetical protein
MPSRDRTTNHTDESLLMTGTDARETDAQNEMNTETETDAVETETTSDRVEEAVACGQSDCADGERCHETVDPGTREDVLTRDDFRCQACGAVGTERGGVATLHVHHIERPPEDMDEHDVENLTTFCRACHLSFHQQSTLEDAPIELTDADRSELLPRDIDVLRFLATHGPARTGSIAAGLSNDLAVSSVRERLWVLMGLDNRVEPRDRQVVDQDAETGAWGLADQIETSARGHIPDDRQVLLQRAEDEQVKRALDTGCDRQAVMDVFELSRRSTFNKEKRAYAYEFPLDAFSRGGRPTEDARGEATASRDDLDDDDDGQQRLVEVADEGGDAAGTGDAVTVTAGEGADVDASRDQDAEQAVPDADETAALQEHLQEAIESLQALDSAL